MLRGMEQACLLLQKEDIQPDSFLREQIFSDLHDPLLPVDPKLLDRESLIPCTFFCNYLNGTGADVS